MKKEQGFGSRLFDVCNILFCTLLTFVCIYPFYYVLINTISDNNKVALGQIIFFPEGLHFENYISVFRLRGIGSAALTSVLRTVLGTLTAVISASFVGYVMTKKEFWHRKFWYRFFVITMYFSAGLIPGYVNMKNLGLINSFWVYVLPALICPYNMILVKTYEQLQDDYYRVLLPLFDTANSSTLKKLFGDTEKENLYTLQQDLISLCDDICLQEKRIQAIYFYSADESRSYFYSALTRSVEKLTIPISVLPNPEYPYQRVTIGARRLNIRKSFSSGFDVNVIGIQSPSLPLIDSGTMPATRTVIFYSLDGFDDIVEKYRSVSSARYYITSTDGIVLYDSAGEYAYNESTYCDYFSDIAENADVSSLTIGGVEYLAGCTSSRRDSYHAGFLVSREDVFSGFRRTSRILLAVMLAFCVLMSVVFLCSNRLIGQRFAQIENGMREIGHQRLDYRLPVDPRHSDEFTRIAHKFNQMCDELQDEIDHNYTYQMLQKTAEYKALQTSINPHFLYNSLEILRERLEESAQSDCAEMVVLLSRFFEYQMRGESIVNIQQELRALQSYIELLSIKSQYIFEYSLEIDEKIKEACVPKLILQPLFENYYIHGLRSNGEDFIRIRGSLDASGKFIHIDFCDNGRGIEPERILALNETLKNVHPDETHIGLQNVNSRLRLMFGAEAGVVLLPNADNIGINVRVFFPKETENLAFQPRSARKSPEVQRRVTDTHRSYV